MASAYKEGVEHSNTHRQESRDKDGGYRPNGLICIGIMPPPLVLSGLWFSFGLFNHIKGVSVSETPTQGSPNRVPTASQLVKIKTKMRFSKLRGTESGGICRYGLTFVIQWGWCEGASNPLPMLRC